MKVTADMRRKMENLITSSFLDTNYPVNELWQITTVKKLYNPQFASDYRYIVWLYSHTEHCSVKYVQI